MDAIILAGGLGTRLAGTVLDLPKPMAPIAGRPLLSYILDYLTNCDVSRIVLSVGYKKQPIIDYFGCRYGNLPIEYCCEDAPLGTGGAIRQSLALVTSPNALITNGDTLFPVEITTMMDKHLQSKADVTIAVRQVANTGRYGAVEVNDAGRITSFAEKSDGGAGYINGGMYIVRRRSLTDRTPAGAFSFERDFLQRFTPDLSLVAVPSDAYFIDIGIPSDYHRAQSEVGSAA